MGYGEIIQPDIFELQETVGEYNLPESSGEFYPEDPYDAFIADRKGRLPAAYAAQQRNLHEARVEVHAIHHSLETVLSSAIAEKTAPIDTEIAKLEKPNPFYRYKLAKGGASVIGLFSGNRFLSHAVEASHKITSAFRTRRSERSFGLNHIKEDLVDKPVRAIRRKEMIGHLEDKRIRVLKTLIPSATREQLHKAVDRTSEITTSVLKTSRKRLHLPITAARMSGTRKASNVIAHELHEMGALETEDEQFSLAA